MANFPVFIWGFKIFYNSREKKSMRTIHKLSLKAILQESTCLVEKYFFFIWFFFVVFFCSVYFLIKIYINASTQNRNPKSLHSSTCKLQFEAELKKFEPRLKFKPRLKYGWFHIKSYSMFQDLSRRSIETDFFGDLRRGLNSLNSDSVYKDTSFLEHLSSLAAM